MSQVQRLQGIHCVREALRANRRTFSELRVRRGRRGPGIVEILALAETREVRVCETLPAPARGDDSVHDQGVELEAGALPEYGLEAILGRDPRGEFRRWLALDGVEDPQNVGSIVRVAEAVGADGLVMTQRRAPPLSPAVARASAGALEWLPVARVKNLATAIKALKKHEFWIMGADPSGAESLFDVPDRLFRADLLLVVGAEGPGIRQGVSEQLDHRLRIPLAGRVASLNVAAAAALLLFEAQRRGRAPSG